MSEVNSPIILDTTGQQILTALQRIADAREGAFSNAGYHNSIFRGKNLGTEFTAEQSAAIVAGTFDDLYVGDYWVIGNVKYRIAGFDIFLHTGDTELTAHHAVIVPDTNLYSAKMNNENVTTGGYYGSLMKTTNLATALTTVQTAFGSSHILSRKTLLCNAVANGAPSGWAWYSTQIDLMTEAQVYGVTAWGTQNQNGYNIGERYSRFPLFDLAPEFITNRSWYWLQDVRNASDFAFVSNYGHVTALSASLSNGVRPAFLIA